MGPKEPQKAPGPRLLDASTPSNRRQLGASTRQKPPLLDTSANHNDQDAPGCRKKPQETLTRTRREPPRKLQEASGVPRTQAGPKRMPQAPGSPRKPQEAPKDPRKPQDFPGTPKNSASTTKGSQQEAPGGPRKLQEPQEPQNAPRNPPPQSVPPRGMPPRGLPPQRPSKKTTGHERPPRPRLLDASTPLKRTTTGRKHPPETNYWTRAPTTTTKTPQDRGP